MLFLGPTGTGKTRVVEAIGEALFGSSNAMIKLDCGEYQHEHEIAKLLVQALLAESVQERHKFRNSRRWNAGIRELVKSCRARRKGAEAGLPAFTGVRPGGSHVGVMLITESLLRAALEWAN